MLEHKQGRYSKYLKPFSLLLNLVILNGLAYWIFPDFEEKEYFLMFLSFSWIFGAWITSFNDIYRHTSFNELLSKTVKQFCIQFVFLTAYNGFFARFAEANHFIKYVLISFICISSLQITIYFLVRYFRIKLGGNFRNVIFIGDAPEVTELEHLFKNETKFGYRILNTFASLENLDAIKADILYQGIDEIYLSYTLLSDQNATELLFFADNHLKIVKYIPSDQVLLQSSFKVDYYDLIPVIPRLYIPLDKMYNRMIKRGFDIVFSLLVIVFILSWLTPVLAILIKLESKGPVFFKQIRTGIHESEFVCYKFRSMYINAESESQQASREDIRITKVGRFIRKTSLDEFPQFINVLIGNMSVVGPRPHMVSFTEMYSKKVNRFVLRHLIKPGITGMAQTHGYRGEINCDRDIVNRFKYDLFYIENWSTFLDIKIIYLTIINLLKGEEKAY